MSMPRTGVTYGRPTLRNAHARIPMSAETDAERAVLRALHRSGVGGATGVSCLLTATELLATVRAAHAPSSVRLHVVSNAASVHLEIDVTGLDGIGTLAETTSPSADFPATRWGTVREQGRTALWADIDRSAGEIDAASRFPLRELRDPTELLLIVTTRLARARTVAEVAGVVEGPLRDHLGADVAALALQDGAMVRLLGYESAHGLRRPPAVGHPLQFPLSSNLPLADSIRDGTFRAYPSARLLDHDFPGVGEHLRADDIDALVTVPATITGHPIGALAFGWRDARPVNTFRPLLVIVAKHSAEAAIRVLSPPPGETTMRPAGLRVPGARQRAETAIGSLHLDLVSRRVGVPGREPIRLTGREFELLVFLGENAGTVHSRSHILREVWGIDFHADTSVVDVTVSRLRRKLGPNLIVTVRDQGYLLRA